MCPRCQRSARAALTSPGEHRQLTVMFCDLVGSSGLAARLDPEELLELVRDYQAACRHAVQRYDGHVAQYLGDGVMIYFGYPVAHEDDVARALHAGLAILDAVAQLRDRAAARGRPRIDVRIGVHTGSAVTGRLGTPERGETLALGPTPNLAAHLQTRAAPNTVLVSETTARLARADFELEDAGVGDTFKGGSPGTRVYRLVRPRRDPDAIAVHRLPLVGRQSDTTRLLADWQDARAGTPRFVLVRGEPGVGKSRLVEWLDEAVGRGVPFLVWRCSPFHATAALYPAAEALARALDLGALPDQDERRSRLAAFLEAAGLPAAIAGPALPLLAELVGASEPARSSAVTATMSAERRKAVTLEAMAALVVAHAGAVPALFMVEDVHWADPTTVDLLCLIASRGVQSGRRFMMLVTARTDFTWPALRPSPDVHELRGLDGGAARALIAAVAEGKELPAEVVDRIAAMSDGVPLYLEEVTRAVLESGQLREHHDRYELPDGDALAVVVPQSLRDSLTARLDRLGSARVTAHVAAVIGRRFSRTLLEAVAARDVTAVRADLDRLESAGLIRACHDADGSYEFKHALVHRAAYDTLLKQSRHDIHARVAAALVARHAAGAPVRPEVLAHHFSEARDGAAAVHWWLQAGRRSLRASANREAVAHARAGLAALGDVPPGEARDRAELALYNCLGPALIGLEGFASSEVGRVYARATAVGEALGSPPELFPALWGSWIFHLVRGELGRAHAIAQNMLAIGERSGDEDMCIEARWRLGAAVFWTGPLTRADAQLAHAAAQYVHERHRAHAFRYGQDPGVALHCYRFFTLWMQGQPRHALAALDTARALAARMEHPSTMAWVLVFDVMAAVFERDPVRTARLAEDAIAFCSEQAQPFWLATSVVARGWARVGMGDDDGGFAQMHDGLALYRASGALLAQPLWCGFLAEVALARHRNTEAAAAVAEGLAIVVRTGEVVSEVDLHRLNGQIAARAGRVDEAIAVLGRAVVTAQHVGAVIPGLRAATALHRLMAEQGLLGGRVASPLPGLLERCDPDAATADLLDARAALAGGDQRSRR